VKFANIETFEARDWQNEWRLL